jgi:uncharacterized phage infection (PIP) family protein YhgE
MSTKTYESPREAAAAVIEVNNAYRQKLAKASTKIKEKNTIIKKLRSQRVEKESDNQYIKKLEKSNSELIEENSNLQAFVEENESLKEQNEELQNQIKILSDKLQEVNEQNQKETNETKKDIAYSAETSRQLLLASLHIAGQDAELKEFRKLHPDSELLDASDEFFEDGRPKSKAKVIYEQAFDARAEELGISDPLDYRPK